LANSSVNMALLREAVSQGRIEWRRHALERMLERGISRADVKATLLAGGCIESYPEDFPLPSLLIFGWVEMRPLHVVVAYNEVRSLASIITVYQPSPEYFENDWQTRKKK
jgi:hypothetical protein